ncbi:MULTISPECIES: hypothetical protein [unclassified Mesorhizobium]|uniref:hypothetical protein n=1 Tax=unclassified Mesorhizobium TaxID=325217 RepID=UPI003014BEF3
MADLLIENIDDDLVRAIERNARMRGTTVDEEAIRLIELGLANVAQAEGNLSHPHTSPGLQS